MKMTSRSAYTKLMKTLLKHFIIDTVTLYLVSQLISGIVFADGLYTLLLAGVVLALATLIVRPIINILILPLNLVTFGLFKWVAYAVTLYLVTLVVPGFKLLDFAFSGFGTQWFSIPPVFVSGVFAFILFSFVISFISSIVYWIFK